MNYEKDIKIDETSLHSNEKLIIMEKRIPWNKGIPRTEEEKRKMSENRKGYVPWNKGKKMPPNVGIKVAEANRNRIWKDETRQRMSIARKGKKFSKVHCKSIAKGLEGHIFRDKTKQKISIALKKYFKEHESPFLGKHHSEEAKKKISKSRIGKPSPNKGKFGILNPNWKGGISSESYGTEFNSTVKQNIINRDGKRCRNPGCRGTAVRLATHHIDYNKKNNSPENLITLCTSCNSRANQKRELWTSFYKIQTEAICHYQQN